MKNIWEWYNKLSNRTITSLRTWITIVAVLSSIMAVTGVSINDWTHRIWISITIFILISLGIFVLTYWVIGVLFRKSISLIINRTSVQICYDDIFETPGWKVIGCDSHFDTRVDDVVISKKSLHGQLMLEHGKIEEIKVVVNDAAERLGLRANSDGLYDFELGTIIPYHSSVDDQVYLMLAMSKLNGAFEAHINMAQYEQMLMKMWKEISRVYASNDIVLPLLGEGISRFEEGPKERESLLKCMMCTLNASGISFNSEIKVTLLQKTQDITLYEYKDMFKSIQRR